MVHEIHRTEVVIGNKTLSFETGRMANLANASVIVRYGDTECLVTVVMSETQREGIDFLPLMVNVEERMHSAGKIPGGFIKREGRPGDPSVLTGRVIDRPIRPLFPDGIRNDINVTIVILGTDVENVPDMVALNGATCALLISDIPFTHTVAGIRVAKVDGKYIFNPTYEQKDASKFELILVATREKVMMLESNCNEVPEKELLDAMKAGHEEIKKICDCLDEFRSRIGKEKQAVEPIPELPAAIREKVESIIKLKTDDIYSADGKKNRDRVFSHIRKEIDEFLKEYFKNIEDNSECAKITVLTHEYEFKTIKKIVRENILKNDRRPDNRTNKQIRDIHCEVGVVKRTHGTALFTRGETQVLGTVTLAAPGNVQTLDDIHPYLEKRYIHHYQALPFSYGDTGMVRGPGRREIGHGALAEKALFPVIPNQDSFPYVIRVYSEVMSSNGSTSMGSTCASTLSLMDAGVPILRPVSGIAMGLITSEKGEYVILSDLMGTEDFMGDMDFKVAGTSEGVTAIQMDTKIDGLTHKMIEDILAQAKEGRAFILGKMLEAISEPRPDLSQYAPRIYILKINPEKIGDIIGPGGKIVRKIIEETGVEIDIEDDGRVYITSTDAKGAETARKMIERLVEEIEIGRIYKGTILRLENYGAFIQLIPGKDGLLHISRISHSRVNDIHSVLRLNQKINVKVAGIDEMGRVDLTTVDIPQDEGEELDFANDKPRPAGEGDRPDRGGYKGSSDRSSGSRGGGGRRDSRPDSRGSDRYPKRDKPDRD
jgi:polyribonucleotide nucleotidyltransferase